MRKLGIEWISSPIPIPSFFQRISCPLISWLISCVPLLTELGEAEWNPPEVETESWNYASLGLL